MSYRGSDKEFYLALHIKFFQEKLEKTINLKITGDIVLDKNLNGRKVDIYSVLSDDREFFMELQLNKADITHLKQLVHIIKNEYLNNYVIIWIALEHDDSLLKQVEDVIENTNKNICFYALTINRELIDYLQKINEMNINDRVNNLNMLNSVDTHYLVKEIYYKVKDELNLEPTKKVEVSIDLENKYDVMKMIYMKLQEEIYYYPSIHRDKKIDGNVISLGGGSCDTSYYIGINRYNFLFIDLKFGESQNELFEILLQQENEVNSKFDYMTEFNIDERRISTSLYFDKKRELRIRQLVRIVDKYIKYFSPYIYNKQYE